MEDLVNDLIVSDLDAFNHENYNDKPLYPESFLISALELASDGKARGINLERPVSLQNPGPNLRLRPLRSCDYERGFVEVLGQLTKIGNVTIVDFLNRFRDMAACPGTYYVTVLEDTQRQRIIGAATLVIEQKFIRGCAKRAMVEDVVVAESHRGQQLGKVLMLAMILLAEKIGVYKINLTCNESTKPYYLKLGFQCEEGSGINLTTRLQ